jgi:hypothetical protein
LPRGRAGPQARGRRQMPRTRRSARGKDRARRPSVQVSATRSWPHGPRQRSVARLLARDLNTRRSTSRALIHTGTLSPANLHDGIKVLH